MEASYPRWIWPPKSIVGWRAGTFLAAQVGRVTERIAAEHRPDAILATWLPDVVAACLLGRRLGVRVIGVAEGSDVNALPREYRWWRYARGILNRDSAAQVFVSHALKAEATRIGLSHACQFVVHNGADPEQFRLGPARTAVEHRTVLSVGHLTPIKGHAVLLEALALMRRRGATGIRLQVVGEGPLRRQLECQAETLAIRDCVEFVGAVRQSDLPGYYQAADVFCLPSRNEGFGCVVTESMSCGIPVVASRVGGVPEQVSADRGILVPPGDAVALADALERALNTSWDAEKIRADTVRRFAWDVAGEALRSIVNEVGRHE